MDDTGFVNLEVDLTTFYLGNRFTYICSNGARFRVWHQVARTENTTQTTYLSHYTWHSYDNINISPSAFNLGNIVVQPNKIRTCVLSFLFLIRSTKHQYTYSFAGSVRKGSNTANHLIGLARINTQANIDIYRSIKLGSGNILYQCRCILQRVSLVSLNFGLCRFLIFC